LPAIRHFYFALTRRPTELANASES
jgi:hypothetical protein